MQRPHAGFDEHPSQPEVILTPATERPAYMRHHHARALLKRIAAPLSPARRRPNTQSVLLPGG